MGSLSDRRADKRALISDAAIQVFAEKGFHQARVSDIARRAGVADGTIYLYFKNKEDLLLSIFEESMDIMLRDLKASMEGATCPRERLRRFAAYHLSQVRDHRALAEVLQVELRLSTKFLKDYRPEKLWQYLEVFRQIIRDGQVQGLIREEVDPLIASWAFFGSLDQLAMQWVLAGPKARFTLDAAVDQVAEVFIRGVEVR